MAEKMTRRTFMKSAAAAAAAISLSGVLVGCGGGLAQDEVQIGAFTAKVYNAKAFWVGGTGTNSSNYITATARLNAGHEKQHLCFAAVSGHVCGHHW